MYQNTKKSFLFLFLFKVIPLVFSEMIIYLRFLNVFCFFKKNNIIFVILKNSCYYATY
ncbi:protein of unknown function [Tenacibaculum aestuariivivum]